MFSSDGFLATEHFIFLNLICEVVTHARTARPRSIARFVILILRSGENLGKHSTENNKQIAVTNLICKKTGKKSNLLKRDTGINYKYQQWGSPLSFSRSLITRIQSAWWPASVYIYLTLRHTACMVARDGHELL